MLLNSIRWRVQLWYGLLLLLVIVAFSVTAYQLERGRRFKGIDEELHMRLGAVTDSLHKNNPFGGDGPGPGRGLGPRPPMEDAFRGEPPHDDESRRQRAPPRFNLDARTLPLFDNADTNGFFYVIWSRGGEKISFSSNAPPDIARPGLRTAIANSRSEGNLLEVFETTPPGECLLVGRSVLKDVSELERFAWSLGGVGGVVLLLGLAGGWGLASRAIKPIESISATAVKIAAGDLSQRIANPDTGSELGRLTAVLNSTFDRLEAAFAQQGRFTADAAHELRTPVSVIILQAQTALKGERSGPEYRKTIEACQRAAQRMKTLLESLLELARLDGGQEPMNRMQFDLATLAGECLDLVEPLAQQKGVKLARDLAPVKLNGDPGRISQVVTNLLNNAIYYNKEGGEVRVAVREENGNACVTVEDTGAGIGEEDLPRIFERFYRADKSRTNAGEHSGLGLAICRAIISAHGGEITVASRLGIGSTFTVRLPLG